jgi:hypothetical protein
MASLSYFCSLGGIRFVINEWFKENTLLIYYCGGTVPNPTNKSGSLPVRINPVGYNSPMQAPNEQGIGSSRTGGSSGALGDDRLLLQQRIIKIEDKVRYFREQLEGAKQDLDEILSKKPVYIQSGNAQEWYREYTGAVSALNDCNTNLSSEMRMYNILQTKLEKGEYSMSAASATTKRSFTDSSMYNEDSSTHTKRTSDNQ